ncbi:hypothetical protein PpBr36_05358 [Pyricularia pennisetigena]|uniref:hypothetical protein n=1 Tax=Pyricularia pennisetigena TaxID=1578925 RepID=UPI001153E4E2|nr:hypothetical protein PpBr36_05358 [Pyricularia pennisetigena]TLS27219.1 hypothetical protein PpBr36_05358 [Pyricularia pennisetigena]
MLNAPPPRPGSESMEIFCKLRHIRGAIPSWVPSPIENTNLNLKPFWGTANLGLRDLGGAPVRLST